MKIEDYVLVLLQAQAQGEWDVEAQVKMICYVVEESQKGSNGQRSDRDSTFQSELPMIWSLDRVHVLPAKDRFMIDGLVSCQNPKVMPKSFRFSSSCTMVQLASNRSLIL